MPPTPADASHRWRAGVFGLDLDLPEELEAVGLAARRAAPGGRRARVDLTSRVDIERAWRGARPRRVSEERFGEGPPARTIDVDPEVGYRLYARGFGRALVAPDGRLIRCAPPGSAGWRWQRFFVGRVLPFAALLRGLEVLHAGAVALGGRVAAFVGPSGIGKTSLAVRLALRGAPFVTDDVLAVEVVDGEVMVHPGAAVTSLRAAEMRLMAAEDRARLGAPLGRSGKSYFAVTVPDGPLPLGALCFLRREPPGTGVAVERLAAPDPRLLLGSAFIGGVTTPARLVNQLDVCAAIARRVPLFGVSIPPGVAAADLAAIVEDELAGVGACAS